MRTALAFVLSGLCPTLAIGADDAVPALIATLEEIRTEEQVPAFAALLVNREGTVWSGARGYADLADERPVTPATRFRIGSITKAFTGMALLLAEARGDLRLDDEVAALVDAIPYTNPWAAEHPVTVAQLLEHSAGFQDWVNDEWNLNDPLPLSEALAYRPASRTSRWPPGMHSSYSNSGPGVAAWVFERVSGEDFEVFVTERIFAPLGMRTARLSPDAETLKRLATGYDTDGRSVIPYWHVILRPSAAISLEPGDMAPFIRMLLNRGRIDGAAFLTPTMVSRMERPRTTLAARAGLDYGYGLGIYQWQRNGHSLYGHGGDGDGYLAHFGYSPDSGRGFFVVVNVFRHRPLRRMRAALEDWVVAESKPGEPPPAVYPAPARYTGRYRQVTSRFGRMPPMHTIEVRARDGRLYTLSGNGRERELVHLGDGRFRRPGQTVATTVFATAADGRLYLQGPIGNYVRLGEH